MPGSGLCPSCTSSNITEVRRGPLISGMVTADCRQSSRLCSGVLLGNGLGNTLSLSWSPHPIGWLSAARRVPDSCFPAPERGRRVLRNHKPPGPVDLHKARGRCRHRRQGVTSVASMESRTMRGRRRPRVRTSRRARPGLVTNQPKPQQPRALRNPSSSRAARRAIIPQRSSAMRGACSRMIKIHDVGTDLTTQGPGLIWSLPQAANAPSDAIALRANTHGTTPGTTCATVRLDAAEQGPPYGGHDGHENTIAAGLVFRRTWATWVFKVESLDEQFTAISAVERPREGAGVHQAFRSAAPSVGGGACVRWWLTNRSMSRRVMVGESVVLPRGNSAQRPWSMGDRGTSLVGTPLLGAPRLVHVLARGRRW